jgi:hypothetical protein
MYAYANQTTTIYWPNYNQQLPPTSNVELPARTRRMRPVFDWRTNKANGISVPPVLLEACTAEPYPKPLVVRLATVDWCARRLAARRRHLPLRSRPGFR